MCKVVRDVGRRDVLVTRHLDYKRPDFFFALYKYMYRLLLCAKSQIISLWIYLTSIAVAAKTGCNNISALNIFNFSAGRMCMHKHFSHLKFCERTVCMRVRFPLVVGATPSFSFSCYDTCCMPLISASNRNCNSYWQTAAMIV